MVEYIVNSSYFKEVLWKVIKDMRQSGISCDVKYRPPQIDEGLIRKPVSNALATKKPIFITGRFRSGSTFLWQLFRHIDGITAYYEPLNENRWFLERRYKTDPTHLGVSNYAEEYRGLGHLSDMYHLEWSLTNLYMDEKHYEPDLVRYLTELIQKAPGRPVLQFNRVDFRLPWLKANFPDASIVFLYRHPREQWMSLQKDGPAIPTDYKLTEPYQAELFYLIHWAKDLRTRFPFLEPEGQHPYSLHYYIWRLSFLFAATYADHFVCYEELINDLLKTFSRLSDYLNIDIPSETVTALMHLNKGKTNKRWKVYAPEKWYQTKENECEKILKTFFNTTN